MAWCNDDSVYRVSTLRLTLMADIRGLQQPDGSFFGDQWGEVDTRFSYCALSCLSLIGRLGEVQNCSVPALPPSFATILANAPPPHTHTHTYMQTQPPHFQIEVTAVHNI